MLHTIEIRRDLVDDEHNVWRTDFRSYKVWVDRLYYSFVTTKWTLGLGQTTTRVGRGGLAIALA